MTQTNSLRFFSIKVKAPICLMLNAVFGGISNILVSYHTFVNILAASALKKLYGVDVALKEFSSAKSKIGLISTPQGRNVNMIMRNTYKLIATPSRSVAKCLSPLPRMSDGKGANSSKLASSTRNRGESHRLMRLGSASSAPKQMRKVPALVGLIKRVLN